jgi:hypothetical protein
MMLSGNTFFTAELLYFENIPELLKALETMPDNFSSV